MKRILTFSVLPAAVLAVSACSPSTVTQGDFLEQIESTTQAYLTGLDGSAVKVMNTRANPSGDVLSEGQFVFNPDGSALGQVSELSPVTASTVTIEIACPSPTTCVERTQEDWAPSTQPLPAPDTQSFSGQALELLASNPPAGDVTYLLGADVAEMEYTSRAGVPVNFSFAQVDGNLATVSNIGEAITTTVVTPLDPQPLPSEVLTLD